MPDSSFITVIGLIASGLAYIAYGDPVLFKKFVGLLQSVNFLIFACYLTWGITRMQTFTDVSPFIQAAKAGDAKVAILKGVTLIPIAWNAAVVLYLFILEFIAHHRVHFPSEDK